MSSSSGWGARLRPDTEERLRGLTAGTDAGTICWKDWSEKLAMITTFHRQQRAVQLVGPDKLELNPAKPVSNPGRTRFWPESRLSACASPI